jgi:ABC-type transporter Mla MlaB component
MQINKKRCKDGQKLVLTGSLVIEELADLHEAGLAFANEQQRIVIDISHIDRLDVAGIQWLLSAAAFADRNGKSIRIDGMSAAHLAVIDLAGVTLPDTLLSVPAKKQSHNACVDSHAHLQSQGIGAL